jgi:hypothetical protein
MLIVPTTRCAGCGAELSRFAGQFCQPCSELRELWQGLGEKSPASHGPLRGVVIRVAFSGPSRGKVTRRQYHRVRGH